MSKRNEAELRCRLSGALTTCLLMQDKLSDEDLRQVLRTWLRLADDVRGQGDDGWAEGAVDMWLLDLARSSEPEARSFAARVRGLWPGMFDT
jgi:hypothetical protein